MHVKLELCVSHDRVDRQREAWEPNQRTVPRAATVVADIQVRGEAEVVVPTAPVEEVRVRKRGGGGRIRDGLWGALLAGVQDRDVSWTPRKIDVHEGRGSREIARVAVRRRVRLPC